MPSRKPQPPGAPSSLVMPPPTLVGAGHPADASSHPSLSHRVLGAVKSSPHRDSRCQRMPGSGPGLRVGATILAGRQRLCVPSVSVEPGRMGASRGLPSVLATTRCGRRPLFCGIQTGPREGGSILLPSPGAPRLLSTPRPTRRLNPCDRRGHSAASRESGAAQALQALLPERFREQGRTLGSWPLGPWGPRRAGEARPRFQPGTRAGLALAGVSVRPEPSP